MELVKIKKDEKIIKETTKIYSVEKGQDDFKVWIKGSDFLCDYMVKKRRRRFSIGKTKRKIKVCITILELSNSKNSALQSAKPRN